MGTLQLWTTVLSCSLMGCLLNYALFLCTTTNSALTTTIVGVLKGVAATALGELTILFRRKGPTDS